MALGFSDKLARDQRRQTAQRLAVDSTRNIADLDFTTSMIPDIEVADLTKIIRAATSPLPIAEVASITGWASGKVAEALSRGGAAGLFEFSKDDGKTKVQLASDR